MDKNEIIEAVIKLYEKYEVSKSFFEEMNREDMIKGMKGILAELDMKKKKIYTAEDLEIIKEIYGMCC